MEASHWHAFAEHVASIALSTSASIASPKAPWIVKSTPLRDRASLYAVSSSARLLFSNTITAVAVFETGA